MVSDSETEGKISVIKCIPTRALCYGRVKENRELERKNYGINSIFTNNLGCVFTTNNWQHISRMAEENKSKTQ